MEKQLPLETLFQLLQTRDIPGTPEQIALLCIRIGELADINGRDWVSRHRERLLKQWSTAIGHATPATPQT